MANSGIAEGAGWPQGEDPSAARRRAARERQRQSLNLQREFILSQRTSNPARRAALGEALAQIEKQIAAIG